MKKDADFESYTEACNYPGVINDAAVERALAAYCAALNVKRTIRRVTRPWWRDLDLLTVVMQVADDVVQRDAARDARDALAARAVRGARGARAGHAARVALAAHDARDARDALAARDARAALAA